MIITTMNDIPGYDIEEVCNTDGSPNGPAATATSRSKSSVTNATCSTKAA